MQRSSVRSIPEALQKDFLTLIRENCSAHVHKRNNNKTAEVVYTNQMRCERRSVHNVWSLVIS
eukprot:4826817-Prymnesium_polylepis.1